MRTTLRDASPAQIWATLLDEGIYLCSQRTVYRLLAERGESGERRAQATHPAHAKPEPIAAAPNRVRSRDITKLLGPKKWTYYYLSTFADFLIALDGRRKALSFLIT